MYIEPPWCTKLFKHIRGGITHGFAEGLFNKDPVLISAKGHHFKN